MIAADLFFRVDEFEGVSGSTAAPVSFGLPSSAKQFQLF